MRFRWTGLLPLLLATGCEAFRVHPYAVPQDEAQLDRTRKNLARIGRIEPSETFTFAAIGDTQRWQDEVPAAVASINADPDVRFVFHVGDITEYGLAQEYLWINEHLDELKPPLLTVVGNHDLLGNGGAIYEAVYGRLDYSFLFGRTKFVLFDSNSREYSFDGSVPPIDWLERELLPDPTWDRAIVVTHIPPDNGDFDGKLALSYETALERTGNVILSLHGHEHRYRDDVVGDGPVPMVVTNKMASRSWVRITVGPGGVEEVREVTY